MGSPSSQLSKVDDWAAPTDFLLRIVRYAKENKPGLVVECGSGVSTQYLNDVVPDSHIISLEHDRIFLDQTNELTGRKTDLRHCTIKGWWYDYQHDGRDIDMIVVDGPPAYLGKDIRYWAKRLFPFLAEGGAIFVDDLNRPNDRLIFDIWESEFPELNFEFIESERGCGIITKS